MESKNNHRHGLGVDLGKGDDQIILISNDLSHPALSKQQLDFSYRVNRLRPLAKAGYRLVVVAAGGRVGRGGAPTLRSLKPMVYRDRGITVLCPPILRIPGFWILQSTLVTPLMVLLYCKTVRMSPAAITASSVAFGFIAKVTNSLFKTVLVVDWGDPDFAFNLGFSSRVLRFLERVLFLKPGVDAVTYVDPAMDVYISRFRIAKRMFLPPGGFWKGSTAAPAKSDRVGAERVVVYAGHIAPPPTYRLDLLPDAAKGVLQSFPDCRFLIVGSGTYLPILRRKVKALGMSGSFEFTGTVPYSEAMARISRSDVALQLRGDMCLGTKVMDYFALGRAVIASGSFYDKYKQFLKDKDNCLLVPPEAEALKGAIEYLLRDDVERIRIGNRGKETAQQYDWDSQGDVFLRLLREGNRSAGS